MSICDFILYAPRTEIVLHTFAIRRRSFTKSPTGSTKICKRRMEATSAGVVNADDFSL